MKTPKTLFSSNKGIVFPASQLWGLHVMRKIYNTDFVKERRPNLDCFYNVDASDKWMAQTISHMLEFLQRN